MDARQAALKLAAIKTVIDAAKVAEAEVKSYLQSALDPGDRKSATVGDVSVATVSYAKQSATADVTDRHALVDWVQSNLPDEIECDVTVAAADLCTLLVHVADEDNDPRAAAAMQRLRDAVDSARPKVSSTLERRLLADCTKARIAVDLETGEAVPGIEYRQGGAGTYISVRQTDEQKDALIEAWQTGLLDLLDLATSPLQIQN